MKKINKITKKEIEKENWEKEFRKRFSRTGLEIDGDLREGYCSEIIDFIRQEKAKDRQRFIEILEKALKDKILDITDEYRGRYFESGVSVFVGYPDKIIEGVKNQSKDEK